MRADMARQPPTSVLHEAARAWAEAGFYVFPCRTNGKEPAIAKADGGRGVHDATQDIEQIDRWWTANPQFNIGVSPGHSAMFALDVDLPLGPETLARLVAENGALPDTLTIRTPSGGLHYWFIGECANTTSKLGPGLDTRGAGGGYVLVPPSIINGKEYEYANEVEEIAFGPDWVSLRLADNREQVRTARGSDLDEPQNLARARSLLDGYIADKSIAVEGSGGDSQTYAIAAEVLNLGLSPDKAFEVMQDWNAACIPPWSDDELRTKIANAAAYAQNDQGAWAVPPAKELFGHFVTPENSGNGALKSRFYPYDLSESAAFQPPAWLIPDLIPAKGTVQIAGKHKSFKTFLALDMALGIAAGARTFGHVPQAAPVVYAVGENAHALVLNHVPAWQEARGVPGLIPFYVVAAVPQASLADEAAELIKAVRARQIAPAVLVIDTATRALRGLDENSAKDMGLFSAMCEYIQRELDCTVIVIRHTGKDESRGGRGSNVIEGDFDTLLMVERHEKSMAVKLTVQEQRNAAELEVPFTFEGRRVGNSLVFDEISTEVHRKITKGDDALAPAAIGAALRAMGAIGEASGITTHVLAAHIVPQSQDESAEDRQHVIARAERNLKALSRGMLAGYVGHAGNQLRWFLPATTA